VFHLDPPSKRQVQVEFVQVDCPGGFELLTKLAAILDLGVQSRLARTPLPGQVEPPFQLPRRPICPKSTWHPPGGYRYWWPVRDQVGPGGPRWTQVAFLEHPPGGVHLAKKSYRTYLQVQPPFEQVSWRWLRRQYLEKPSPVRIIEDALLLIRDANYANA